MPILRRHFDQLGTPQSWSSPVSVIAHIDLDAFYAQCLGVKWGIDPTEPLGCRQWHALIAINYPARKFGLKRGVSVEEAQKLCPGIHLPHVATFKKGEPKWDFHEEPDPNNYKVSLDFFRKESRRIFGIFKEHFRDVEKAGIDEGFVDIGMEVHKEALKRYPHLQEPQIGDEIDISHDTLLDIGAELVNSVRLEIHDRLKYTCSAGIAANKQLAKLGSGYKKPFNQTVVHTDEVSRFLANFKITDAWGWGGKLGKEVLRTLKIDENVEDQCKYVRENFTLIDLQHEFKGDVKLARSLYDLVRGKYASEITPRTLIKSMVAVKDFRRLNTLRTREDVESWLQVFSADLSGRLADLREEMRSVIVPKTITVRQFKGSLLSKQQPFVLKGTEISQLKEQIYSQAVMISKSFVHLPCTYLVVEISHLFELPKERLLFERHVSGAHSHKGGNENENENTNSHEEVLRDNNDNEESLFVDNDNEESEVCQRCGETFSLFDFQEHKDWHFAKDLVKEDYKNFHNTSMPPEPGSSNTTAKRPDSSQPSSRSGSKSPSKKKLKGSKAKQKSILEFFEK